MIDKSHRQFEAFFKTSRQDPGVDDYVQRRNSIIDEDGVENSHKLAGLRCKEKYGGPEDSIAEKEMVFWSDIPSDSSYKSPFMDDTERFLTFEPDHGGWNNIRMAMETALVMSHAMGRTLVLPPEQGFYLLQKSDKKQRSTFSFQDFFHLDAISIEHRGFKVITMEEFLVRVAMKGELRDKNSNKVMYPPNNETNFDAGGRNRRGDHDLSMG